MIANQQHPYLHSVPGSHGYPSGITMNAGSINSGLNVLPSSQLQYDDSIRSETIAVRPLHRTILGEDFSLEVSKKILKSGQSIFWTYVFVV